MSYRMHSEYLRSLFLDNNLAENRFLVDGRPVALLTDSDVTFALTNGGHNVGVLTHPGQSQQYYRVATKAPGSRFDEAGYRFAKHPPHEGSWRPVWQS